MLGRPNSESLNNGKIAISCVAHVMVLADCLKVMVERSTIQFTCYHHAFHNELNEGEVTKEKVILEKRKDDQLSKNLGILRKGFLMSLWCKRNGTTSKDIILLVELLEQAQKQECTAHSCTNTSAIVEGQC